MPRIRPLQELNSSVRAGYAITKSTSNGADWFDDQR